ncbi:hypothetical protein [Microcoleus sp. F4-D5]
MAQVDRTMQILSGDYLYHVRSNNGRQDNTRRLKPLLYKRSPSTAY